jgi:hypothetical protein
MDITLIAPCGLNCALCLGYQREKNKCGGCNSATVRQGYCTSCILKLCPEKDGDTTKICGTFCSKFPCKRLRDLDKRYRTKYGESCLENIALIEEIGLEAFAERDAVKWRCPQCGELLCCHRGACVHCGAVNDLFPQQVNKNSSGKPAH